MTQDNQQGSPKEEAGGYGTPTAEQESPGGGAKTLAQPREEEVFGGTDPGFEPVPRDPSSSPGQPVPGAPPAPNDPAISPVPSHPDDIPQPQDPNAAPPSGLADSGVEDPGAAAPSAEAEMDESNTEAAGPGRPFSSEPNADAAGIPDGSGTDLPDSRSPRDRDDDTFDAG